MASPLSNWYAFWAGNATLTAALPTSLIWLDFIPEKVKTFPRARLTQLGSTLQYMTSGTHIEEISYQLSVFSPDLTALQDLSLVIEGQLNKAHITTDTIDHYRTNALNTGEVLNGQYVYHRMLQYSWQFNVSTP